jgi:hypothetical protein
MKNSNDTIGNRSRDLPVCSALPQPLRHRVPPNATVGYLKIYAEKIKFVMEFIALIVLHSRFADILCLLCNDNTATHFR